MSYYLKKWYFDILTPEKDFIFIYFAAIRICGRLFYRLNLNLNSVSEERIFSGTFGLRQKDVFEIGRSTIKTRYGDIVFSENSARIGLKISNWHVDLEYQYGHNSRETEVPLSFPDRRPNHCISWNPIALSGKVAGSISVDEHRFRIDGFNGYIDYLHSTVFPRKAPAKTLFWGRIHNRSCDLAYSFVQAILGDKTWSKLYFFLEGKTFELDNLELIQFESGYSTDLDINYPKSYLLKGNKPGISFNMKVENIKSAAPTAFIDDQQLGGLKRGILKFVSRDPRGMKFISRADLELGLKNKHFSILGVEFISEYVIFWNKQHKILDFRKKA